MEDADADLRRADEARRRERKAEQERKRAADAIVYAHQLAEIVPILARAMLRKKDMLNATDRADLTAILTTLGDGSARDPALRIRDAIDRHDPVAAEEKRKRLDGS